MSEIKHSYFCDKCDGKLEEISMGHVCRTCARFFNVDGQAIMDINNPNIEKVNRIIERGHV